jgi:hypothetical protein
MKLLTEEIDREFIQDLVDKSVQRLEGALAEIDVSLDYIAALLGDEDVIGAQVAQKAYGRLATPSKTRDDGEERS